MIPLRDVIQSRTRPWVTMGLIAINAAVFIYQVTLPAEAIESFVREYGLKAHAFAWPDVFTSMFVHASLVHAASNLYCLWIFGDNVEDQMGHGRFLVFYLLAGSMAALAQLVFGHNGLLPMVGASGAIAGVMGAYLFMFPRSEVHVFWFGGIVEVPAAVFLLVWFIMQLIGAFDTNPMTGDADGHIAFWAHIGGFLMGVVGVFVFRRPERAQVDWWDHAAR